MTDSVAMSRRRFLLRAARPATPELSCERLFMQYTDAKSEGRLRQFVESVTHHLEGSTAVRLTGREWLARDEFRRVIEPLIAARCLGRLRPSGRSEP
ncbi:MAG: hypothetical protein ABIS06_07500 [Vicinamibacterales bacterium]